MRKLLSATGASLGAALVLLATAAAAQAPAAGPVVVRMYTAADGLTHSEVLPIPMEFKRAVGVQFGQARTTDPRRANIMDWHPAPHERYVVTLSGSATIELSNGKVTTADRDHIILANDFTGKGHRFQANPVGPEPWVYVFLEINKPL